MPLSLLPGKRYAVIAPKCRHEHYLSFRSKGANVLAFDIESLAIAARSSAKGLLTEREFIVSGYYTYGSLISSYLSDLSNNMAISYEIEEFDPNPPKPKSFGSLEEGLKDVCIELSKKGYQNPTIICSDKRIRDSLADSNPDIPVLMYGEGFPLSGDLFVIDLEGPITLSSSSYLPLENRMKEALAQKERALSSKNLVYCSSLKVS